MFDDLKNLFRGKNFIGQIIVINAAVFLLFNLIENIIFRDNSTIYQWLAMPSTLSSFITRPWTAFTYMFMHGGIMHIIFNMLMLYWFGRIFQDFMGEKRLSGLYFLGGLAGGLLFLAAYSLLVLAGEPLAGTSLVGSSAAVMAITIAAGFRFPDYVMNLLLIGPVRLKYVALVVFILSTVVDFSSNMGGKIAHLGGAAMGYIYIRNLSKGKDYALGFYQFFARMGDWFSRRPKMRVVKEPKRNTPGSRTASRQDGGPTQAEIQAKTDAILDKISKSGYENLSKEEKEFLFRMSKKN